MLSMRFVKPARLLKFPAPAYPSSGARSGMLDFLLRKERCVTTIKLGASPRMPPYVDLHYHHGPHTVHDANCTSEAAEERAFRSKIVFICHLRRNFVQEHVINGLELKVAPQSVEDCLEKLGYLLAGRDNTPAIVGVRAHELAKAKKAGDGLEVCNVLDNNCSLCALPSCMRHPGT